MKGKHNKPVGAPPPSRTLHSLSCPPIHNNDNNNDNEDEEQQQQQQQEYTILTKRRRTPATYTTTTAIATCSGWNNCDMSSSTSCSSTSSCNDSSMMNAIVKSDIHMTGGHYHKSNSAEEQVKPVDDTRLSLSMEIDSLLNKCLNIKSPHDILYFLTSALKSVGAKQDLVRLLHFRSLIFTHMNMLFEAERDVKEIITKLDPYHAPTWYLIKHILQEKKICTDWSIPMVVMNSTEFTSYKLPEFTFSQDEQSSDSRLIPREFHAVESSNIVPSSPVALANEKEETLLGRPISPASNLYDMGLTPDTRFEVPKELECTLCSRIFHHPITLPCGHSFDKACLARVFDYTSKCPICRLQMHILPSEIPVSTTIQNIVKRYYPSHYKTRMEMSSKEDAITLANEGEECKDIELPLFVLGDYVLYPGTKLDLHIFEPRYRLLMRRCMSGSRQFGLISTNGRTLSKYGTVAKITNVTQLDGGRSLVSTIGSRRFSIEGEPWLVDGYNVARVSFFKEESILDSDRLVVDEISRNLEVLLDNFFAEVGGEMRSAIEQKIGPLPPRENIVDRSFWLASLLPLRAENKLELLRITSTKERLSILHSVTTELAERQNESCLIQ